MRILSHSKEEKNNIIKIQTKYIRAQALRETVVAQWGGIGVALHRRFVDHPIDLVCGNTYEYQHTGVGDSVGLSAPGLIIFAPIARISAAN